MIVTRASIWWRVLRASNLPTVWTNVLLGTLLALPADSPTPNWWSLACMLVAGSFAYLAGMAHNDLCDESFDRACEAPRPLVRGELTRHSLQRAMTALLVGFVVAVTGAAMVHHGLNVVTDALIIGLLGSIMGYNLLHRSNWAIAALFMAACRALLVLLGAQIAGDLTSGPVLFAAAAVACWTAGITLLARGERGGESAAGGWLGLFILATVLTLGVGLSGMGSLPVATFGGLLVLGVVWVPTIWREHARGRHVPAVMWSILGLCVLDAAMFLATDHFIAAGVAVACMALCMVLQRRAMGT